MRHQYMVGTVGSKKAVRVFPCSSPDFKDLLAMKLTQKTIGAHYAPGRQDRARCV